MELYFTNEEVAIITGAGSGIGAGTAVRFAQFGVSGLCLSDLNGAGLQEVRKKCIEQSAGRLDESTVITVIGDITEEETCAAIVDQTKKSLDRIDILINNAGIVGVGLVEHTPISQFDCFMKTNLRSVVVLTQLCIPYLRRTKGSVVNVSSIAGVRSFPGRSNYCMSKAALNMYTKCLALELAPDGVRVNAVNPGLIDTPMIDKHGLVGEQRKKFLEDNKKCHPLGRVGTVDDVADSICFLASSRASFMTGNLTFIDGGRNCLCPR